VPSSVFLVPHIYGALSRGPFGSFPPSALSVFGGLQVLVDHFMGVLTTLMQARWDLAGRTILLIFFAMSPYRAGMLFLF